MSFRQLDAGQGIAWLTEAAHLLLRNPAPFVLMGLALALGLMVPLLGSLALAVFGPALYGGIAYAAQEQAAGRQVAFAHLFRAFQQPGKLPKMLLLCLPGLAAGALLVVLGFMLVGGALLAAGVAGAVEADTTAAASLGFGGLLLLLLALALGLTAQCLVMFAIPRVMLGEHEPFAAMQQSLAACLGNLGAVLVFLLTATFGALALILLLSLLSTMLAQLAVTSVLLPLMATANWIASRQLFDDAGASAPPPPPAVEL